MGSQVISTDFNRFQSEVHSVISRKTIIAGILGISRYRKETISCISGISGISRISRDFKEFRGLLRDFNIFQVTSWDFKGFQQISNRSTPSYSMQNKYSMYIRHFKGLLSNSRDFNQF